MDSCWKTRQKEVDSHSSCQECYYDSSTCLNPPPSYCCFSNSRYFHCEAGAVEEDQCCYCTAAAADCSWSSCSTQRILSANDLFYCHLYLHCCNHCRHLSEKCGVEVRLMSSTWPLLRLAHWACHVLHFHNSAAVDETLSLSSCLISSSVNIKKREKEGLNRIIAENEI